MLSDEEKKEERRRRHREAQRRSNKKLMTEKNPEKRKKRQKKALDSLKKYLSKKAVNLLREKVVEEGHPELIQVKAQLAKCQKQCESLMKCANNLFDLVNETRKQADLMWDFISEMPAGEDKFAQESRRDAAYTWSRLKEPIIDKKMCAHETNLDRIQKFLDELKTSKKE